MGNRLVEVTSADKPEDLQHLWQAGYFQGDDWMVVGSGSNTIFITDTIQRVLQYTNSGFLVHRIDNKHSALTAGGGALWEDCVAFAVKNQLWGIENLAAIPGTVGAAPVQNIGAYGTELQDSLAEVTYFDTRDGKTYTIQNKECSFGYRDSIFKNDLKNKVCITSITLQLDTDGTANLTYPALRSYITEHGGNTDIGSMYQHVTNLRAQKLADPSQHPNCGSFFKNPEFLPEVEVSLLEKYPGMPIYEGQHGMKKTSAAWLIDHSGLKGYAKDGVATLATQPLVLINTGNATTQALEEMIRTIQSTVAANFQLHLTPEVNLV